MENAKGHGEAERYSATFVPRRATALWNIRVDKISGFTPEVEASGIVTGVAEAWSISDDAPAGNEVTVPFGLTVCSAEEHCLRASVVVFGDKAPHDITHRLRIFTTSKYYYDFDITEQVHSAPDPKNVDIEVSGIALPTQGTGMTPGVGDWEDADKIEIDF